MYKGLKVYIAGPITGTDDYKERFATAEKYLRDLGALPMHSAYLPQGYTHAEYLYICRAMIDVCEAIYFLDGYSESKGSRMEFCYATSKHKQLLYEGLDPVMTIIKAREYSPPLDRGIQREVEILAAGGIETYESCEGGQGHPYPEPTVRFYGDKSEGFKALAIALQNDLKPSAIRRIWNIIDGEPIGPDWEMTFTHRE